MTLFLELSRPWNWRPFWFQSRIMVRFGWGWVAAGWLRIPFHEWCLLDKRTIEWRQ